MAPVHCIVKLGGSALTHKEQLETLRAESLPRAARMVLGLCKAGAGRCIIVHGAGEEGWIFAFCRLSRFCSPMSPKANVIDSRPYSILQKTQMRISWTSQAVLLHTFLSVSVVWGTFITGAQGERTPNLKCSFGHFQAKANGVASGSPAGSAGSEALQRGLCLTRLSVTKLNHLVTEELVKCGVPAVGISPFGTWKTASRKVSQAGIAVIKDALDAGYVPVLHGDCALDTEQHCSILSGDAIIEVLAKEFAPRHVVFLTDVSGIYDRPPDSPGARLMDSITVSTDGSMNPPVLTSVLPHDTTGGVTLKLQAAVNIVIQSHGAIPVLICKLDSEAAQRVCLTGELGEGEGTRLSFAAA